MRIFQVFLQVAFLPNAAFGQRTDVGDGSGARRRRGDGDGQELQRWNGDKSIATWTAVGRWPLTNGDTRKYAYEKMFDNNVHTYWKGVDDENNKVIVSFNSPIMFHKLEFIARPDSILKQERYQDVCLYLNNVNTDVCTDSNKITESGETIVLEKEMTNVKTVELRFEHAPAAVAELDIYYKAETSCFAWQKGNKENSNYGVIPFLEKTWRLVMNIRPNLEEARYTNLFHATVGVDKYTYGDRILRVQLIHEMSRLSVWSAVKGPKIKWGIWPEKLELHKWTKAEFRQDLIGSNYIFSIWFNGVQVFEEENKKPQIFNNVELFVGDPKYEGAEPPVDICDSWFHTPSNSIQLYGKKVAPTTDNCYEDDIPRVLPVEIKGGLGAENKKSACIVACKGYKYAGMEDGNQCFCGDISPAAALKRPGECTTVCPGDKSEMCGALWRINIFDVPESMGWLEIYSQTEKSNLFSACQLGSCDLGSEENFINFDIMPDSNEYHFKLVWDEGTNDVDEDVEIQWKQSKNPLSATDVDMSPTEAKMIPSNTIPVAFYGLSLSSSPTQLLDGRIGIYFPYSIGNTEDWKLSSGKAGGGEGIWGNARYPGAMAAKKTQLFVWVACEQDEGICKGWSEWGECSDACMGTSTRTRSRTGLREESDEEFCDNQDCVTTECKAWGDPHITTFDGAKNDVYGVTTYILAMSRSSAKSVKAFQVRMVTSKYGKVSVAEKAWLDFYDDTRTHVATVETNRNGDANLFTLANQWISEPLTESKSGAGYSFTFTKINKQLTVLTDFNVQVRQKDKNIYVTIPKESYSDKVVGLCGNNDGDRTNDYQKWDGTVLPYTPLPGSKKGSSEYECAKSWMVSETITGRITKRSISNEAGPHPASVSCSDETIIAECDTLLEPSWLSICEPLVSADRRAELVRLCKIDYCMVKEEKTKLDIIMHYVIECQKKSEETILCDWEVQATGQQPVCGSNKEYKGCATMCDLPSCSDYLTNKSCNSKTNTFSSCVCKKDFYLLNGVCVTADACSATGWSDWNEWSSCSNPCGGSRRRLQICQGQICQDFSKLEEEACSGDCNPCVEALCPMDSTCENNDGAAVCKCNDGFDGDGTTCFPQAVATAFSCPSTKCWTYDADQKSCTLTDSCVEVTCGALEMTMKLDEGVFGNAADAQAATGATADADGNYTKKLGLDAAVMSFNTGGTEMHFDTRIEVEGSSRERSDTANHKIDLGNGVKVITSPFGVGVDFQCVYDTAITVSSDAFMVQDISITGTHTSAGTLDTGFNMVVGDGSPIVLGDDLTVTTTWQLELAGVQPHYKNCAVLQGAEAEVQLMKDGCMSETLGVELVANANGITNSVSMKYKTFLIKDEPTTTQTLLCNVMLCKGTVNCARAPDALTSCRKEKDPYNFA